MSTFTDLFQYWQRPTDNQLSAAVETTQRRLAGDQESKHPLFPGMPPQEFWRHIPADATHGPITSCVLQHVCSISGRPQGLLYICEQTLTGFDEYRLTYRDPVHAHILQGRTVSDGGLNMNWSYRPYFFGTIQCDFQIDLGFEGEEGLTYIHFAAQADLAEIDLEQHAIAGFITSSAEKQGTNVIRSLCAWSAAMHISAPRMLVKTKGDTDAFPWPSYLETVFGATATLPKLQLAVKDSGQGINAQETVAAAQAFLRQEDVQQLAERINSTIRELDSPRYEPLKTGLLKLASQSK